MPTERTDVRTTVSLDKVVWQMAERVMAQRGYNKDFSAFIADLIRRDRDATFRHVAAVAAPYPRARQEVAFIADRSVPPKNAKPSPK